jgi:hypothetical protein
VAQHLTTLHWRAGTFALVNYQLLFLSSILLRVPALALLNRVHDPEIGRPRQPASDPVP